MDVEVGPALNLHMQTCFEDERDDKYNKIMSYRWKSTTAGLITLIYLFVFGRGASSRQHQKYY